EENREKEGSRRWGEKRGCGIKSEKSLERKAIISAQLPKPPNFNVLVHNIPYYKDYATLS
ncbi:4746_t:CDS:1, partial [Cetraspora pellucida]